MSPPACFCNPRPEWRGAQESLPQKGLRVGEGVARGPGGVGRAARWFLAALVLLWALAVPAKPLRIAVSDWPPYEYTLRGQAQGLDIALARTALEAMKLEHEFVFYPWKRVLLLAERGEVDAIMSVRPTPQRRAFLWFGQEALSESVNVLFMRKGEAFDVPTLASLQGRVVGVTAGYSYGAQWDALAQSGALRTEDAQTEEQGLRKLLAGRTDAFLCDLLAGWYLGQEMGYGAQLQVAPLTVSSVKNYLAFTKIKSNAGMSARFDAAVQALRKSGVWQRVAAENTPSP